MNILFRYSLILLVAVGVSLPVALIQGSAPVLAGTDFRSEAACQTSETIPECATSCTDPAAGKPNPCPNQGDICDPGENGENCNIITKYINPIINALTVFAGIAVVIGIIVGGIQYASSGGDPQKAAAGKNHVKMAIIGLIGLFFLHAFLRFLIPGAGLLGA